MNPQLWEFSFFLSSLHLRLALVGEYNQAIFHPIQDAHSFLRFSSIVAFFLPFIRSNSRLLPFYLLHLSPKLPRSSKPTLTSLAFVMHFTTAAVAVAILAAQSALSAPVAPPLGNGASPTPTTTHHFAFPSNFKIMFGREMHDLMQREEFAGFARELEDLLARDDLDGSEAFKIPSIVKTIVKGIPHLLPLLG